MDPIGPQSDYLCTMLDVTAERHRVIASNIANVNTPGYKAKELRFDGHLRKALVEERKGIVPRQDGNTVVLELENAALRKNALVYRVFLQALVQQARLTRAAIAGRNP